MAGKHEEAPQEFVRVEYDDRLAKPWVIWAGYQKFRSFANGYAARECESRLREMLDRYEQWLNNTGKR
jgi:hypothetical protein